MPAGLKSFVFFIEFFFEFGVGILPVQVLLQMGYFLVAATFRPLMVATKWSRAQCTTMVTNTAPSTVGTDELWCRQHSSS